MSDFAEVRIINKADVEYLIENLNGIDRDKTLRGGLAAAGKVFASGGKNRLKKRMKSGSKGVTGNLLNSFQVRVKRNKPGVITGFKTGREGGSHAHLIDRGTAKRYWRSKPKYTGVVKPNLFWSDTEVQDYPKAVDVMYQAFGRVINRVNNRL